MWKDKYQKLQADLAAVEKRLGYGTYLADDMVDHDNVGMSDRDPGYWEAMYRSACWTAGYRGEDIGININKELGYVIY